MKQLYQGKTKDVYEVDKYHVLLKFKDDMTGKDGVFDPGENQVGLQIEGQGLNNLMMSDYFFNLFEENQIKTHRVKTNHDDKTMLVRKVDYFGPGLEVIIRFKALGSFIRRYDTIAKPFDNLDGLIEFTLKDDDKNDPLILEDALIKLNVLTEKEIEEIKTNSLKIAHLIKKKCETKNLDLIDLKLEFGKDAQTNEIILMDEISSGNMRVYDQDTMVDSMELAYILEVIENA